jgi:hypothetical protein
LDRFASDTLPVPSPGVALADFRRDDTARVYPLGSFAFDLAEAANRKQNRTLPFMAQG